MNRKPKLLPAVLSFVFVSLLAIWGMTALSVQDALWFLPAFSKSAAYFDLYWDGEVLRVEPSSPEYDALNQAIQEEFAHVRSYPSSAGLSDAALEDLRAEGRLLECYFDEPAMIHSRYFYGASRTFFVPLSGHHADQHRVFNGGRGAPLELQDTSLIMAAAEDAARADGSP